MPEPREVELKLEIGPRRLAALRSRGLKQLGPEERRERLAATYFDTADHDLRKHGLSLRVRSVDGRHIQTVKAVGAGMGAGLFDRPEWETEVSGTEPDLKAARRTPVRDVLGTRDDGQLQPVFAADVKRTIWHVENNGAAIEVSLDEGTIVADGATRKIAELELELKRGPASNLFALARELGAAGSLKLGVRTKSEQGYELASGEPHRYYKAETLKLPRGMTTADAFAAIVRACIRHFRLNEAAVVEARIPEGLHQARVAMRRLRAALSLFKDLIGDPESQAVRARLRTFSGHLGRARDLDVYLERAEGVAEHDPDWIAKLKADREAAYDTIAKTLASRQFRGLMLDLLAWAEEGDWRRPDDEAARARLDGPIEILAAEILNKRRRRVKRRGRDLATLEPEARHQVRIEAKKLRYATEFFSGLVEGKSEKRRYKALLGALEDLQEVLGHLNDIETARLLRAEHATPADSAPDDADREKDLLKQAAAAHDAFSDAKRFWQDFV